MKKDKAGLPPLLAGYSKIPAASGGNIIPKVEDPVHFRPDPDPENQKFFYPDPDPTGSYQESIQTSKFFSHQSNFFRFLNDDYFYQKNEKFT